MFQSISRLCLPIFREVCSVSPEPVSSHSSRRKGGTLSILAITRCQWRAIQFTREETAENGDVSAALLSGSFRFF